jgi:DNA-binding transcriptional ArsR family regulator
MVNRSGTPSLDLTYRALSDPTRRGILERLSRGETRVTDLARPYAMSLPAITKHLHVLERAGLLERRRRGREIHLQISAAPMKAAAGWIEHYRPFWEGSLERLAQYVEQEPARKGSR